MSEVTNGILEDTKVDSACWKLPGQALADRALGPEGDTLLAEWQARYREKQQEKHQ